MKLWRKTVVAFALVMFSAMLALVLPLRSLAAPHGPQSAAVFLPLVLNYSPSTILVSVGPIVGNNEQFVYSPVTATIHVGDTLHWVWDSSGHTVTSGTAPTADDQFCSPNNADCSGQLTSNSSATFDHRFLAAGTYPYFCQIHWSIGMTGTIVVLP